MMTLFRKIFWLGLFLVFTLGFVTLFDHNFYTTQQFSKDAKSEVSELMQMVHPIKRPKDTSDQIPAQ
jgi:hypothetical protein